MVTVSELSDFICERNKSKVLESDTSFNPSARVNCCANWNADTNGVARSRNGGKLYTRLFAECKVAIPGLQHLMVDVNNVQAMITIIRELAHSKLKKELSHVGFVSMTLDQAAQFYSHKHGKQLRATRDVVMRRDSEGNEEKSTIYVIDRDLGNVSYSSWIKNVLDQATMYDLLSVTHVEQSLSGGPHNLRFCGEGSCKGREIAD